MGVSRIEQVCVLLKIAYRCVRCSKTATFLKISNRLPDLLFPLRVFLIDPRHKWNRRWRG